MSTEEKGGETWAGLGVGHEYRGERGETRGENEYGGERGRAPGGG